MLLCKRVALWPAGVLRIDRKCSAPLESISLSYEAGLVKEMVTGT